MSNEKEYKLNEVEILKIENYRLKIEMARNQFMELNKEYSTIIDSLFNTRNIKKDEYNLDLQQNKITKKQETKKENESNKE